MSLLAAIGGDSGLRSEVHNPEHKYVYGMLLVLFRRKTEVR